jgi:hypothetical protein
VLSCERDLHLQAWYVLVRVTAVRDLRLHEIFKKTCSRNMKWDDAINMEVKFTTHILRHDLKVAGLFPQALKVGWADRGAIFSSGDSSALKSKLSECMNPFTFAKKHNKVVPVAGMGAIKIGGSFYRARLMSKLTWDAVNNVTNSLLNMSVQNDDCDKY